MNHCILHNFTNEFGCPECLVSGHSDKIKELERKLAIATDALLEIKHTSGCMPTCEEGDNCCYGCDESRLAEKILKQIYGVSK